MGMLLVMSFILLTQIMFSFEKDHAISSCCRTHQGPLSLTFNCSHCSLTTIPSGIPRNVTVLDLSYNSIKTITGPSFPFTQLRSLHLQGNNIYYISNTAFDRIQNLTLLDVSRNAFNNTVGFPNEAIPKLHQLLSLDIDVYNEFRFDQNFLSLQKLEVLNLNPTSRRLNLRNNTFEGLKNSKIKYLSFNSILRDFETGVFSNLPCLNGLTLTQSTQRVDLLLQSLFGLQNRKMDYIDLSWNHRKFVGIILDYDSGMFLRNICLKYLNLKRDNIAVMKATFLESINDCIETIIISENSLSYDSLFHIVFIAFSRKSLKHFDASWTGHQQPKLLQNDLELYTDIVSYRTYVTEKNSTQIDPYTAFFPKHFNFLNLSFIPTFWGEIPNGTIIADELDIVDLSFPGRFACNYGKISGLKSLKTLNISGFECSRPHKNMLHDMINLTYFVARKCQLSFDGIGPDFFKGLKRLKHIDLAVNTFSKFDINLEDQAQTLETLILRNTNSTRIPTEAIRYLRSLKVLDLRNNKISLISDDERIILDQLKNRNQAFTILLDNNPMLCSCGGENLRFLYWLRMQNIIENTDSLFCLSNGKTERLIDVLNSLESQKFQCYLEFLIPAVGICVMVFICIYLVISSRYKLKYWLITTKMRLFRGWEPMEDEQFDVYVSFHEDCVWTKNNLLNKLQNINNLKISTGPRPGFPIRDGIIRAIESSEKTILVVTNDYLEDDWGKFALNMTLIHVDHTGDVKKVIIIFQEEIKPNNMPNNLMQVSWRMTNFKWPKAEDFKDNRNLMQKKRLRFWKDLFICFNAVYDHNYEC